MDPLSVVGQAVRGGLRLLQLRDPEASDEQLLHLMFSLRRRYPELRLMVNRRAVLARETGAWLHLAEEQPLAPGWPPKAVWGRSVHSVLAARAAEEEGATYLVLGTIFPTPSKPGHPGDGLDLVWQVTQAVRLPVYAIGGVEESQVGALLAAGAYGVAVQRAVLAADDPMLATQRLALSLQRALPLTIGAQAPQSHVEQAPFGG